MMRSPAIFLFVFNNNNKLAVLAVGTVDMVEKSPPVFLYAFFFWDKFVDKKLFYPLFFILIPYA